VWRNKLIRVHPGAVRTLCTLLWLDLGARHMATALMHLRDYIEAAIRVEMQPLAGAQIFEMARLAPQAECDEYLESYGGHKMAAGASLKVENLDAFRKAFNTAVQKQLSKDDLVPMVKADVEVKIPQLTPKFFAVLRRMEPFGPHNMRPVLVTRRCTNRANPRVVGKGGAHLKLEVYADGSVIDAIGFGFGDRLQEVQEASSFTLAYTLSENEFRGRTTLQMMLKAIVIEED